MSIDRMQKSMNNIAYVAQVLTIIERSFSYQDLFLGKNYLSPKELRDFLDENKLRALFFSEETLKKELCEALINLFDQLKVRKKVNLTNFSEHGLSEEDLKKMIRKTTLKSPGVRYFLKNIVINGKRFLV